ncbi:phosphopyruvate hydratase [Conexibacter woesei]|uniref:Enolase n=1 Tax=Conexibacter woesei (strain DSM 14684 / CCUG 47730 / CIP 108061 / JCM 11494 / NBRC 100937 / ID131577) TaxID=469383 RepID=D3F9W2_CONWI|nr:phosphopyruvate hydratase [Conexibacter woesei]ADB51174.1 enolase [Conexibacter woesei DSM 14684]
MTPITIAELDALEILDSRGRPTVEARITLSDGRAVRASVPSGASTGRHEAVERRDGDPARYGGRGVRGAVAAIEGEIAAALIGREPEQRAVDAVLRELDGTQDKSRLGANAILAVSLATARAAALAAGQPLWRHLARGGEVTLPRPMVNILSGGLHAGRQLDFQDFLVIPVAAERFGDALEAVVAVHAAMGELLAERGLVTLKADEGGYGPALADHREALRLLDEAVLRAGFALGEEVAYALDVAATHFHDPASGSYRLASEGRTLDPAELTAYVAELADEHPIVSVEDPLAEDDWPAWAGLTARLGSRLQVIGDDLFTTSLDRLERGIAERSANAVLVKMNQIGTISETVDVVSRARAAGFTTVISARSGETEDPVLADLAVGLAGGQIKIGSVTQSERLAKYNRLLRIERELGDAAQLAPPLALSRLSGSGDFGVDDRVGVS